MMKPLIHPSPAPRGKTSIPGRENPAGQIVLVLQGGGALGAYQGGVYEALSEAGIEPEWVIGTSIGAINGALIAGNEPANRLPRLAEFWGRVRNRAYFGEMWSAAFGGALANLGIVTQ